MTGKLRRLLALPPAERGLFLAAWLRLLAADLGVRLLPDRLARRLLESSAPPAACGPPVDPERLVWLVDAAARHHLGPKRCLVRALVLRRMLHDAGIASEVRIGVRTEGGALRAHAWLEVGGRPLGEPGAEAQEFALLRPAGGEE